MSDAYASRSAILAPFVPTLPVRRSMVRSAAVLRSQMEAAEGQPPGRVGERVN